MDSPPEHQAQALALPGTGEIVDLSDTLGCISALEALRNYERLIREAKVVLTRAITDEATVQGVRSFVLPDGARAVVTPDVETTYDPYVLEEELREAGMPEERISAIIEETVQRRVRVVEAKRAAAANAEYARALEAARRESPRNPNVTIKKG